jgi:probable phosphoglycerate mutase
MKPAVAIPLLTRSFYFLRHGETDSNLRGIVAGSLDVSLTQRGYAQAQAAAHLLEDREITEIYSSDLRRARDTANCVAELLNVSVHIVSGLAERRWGALEGQPRELRLAGVTPPGAETPEEFAERVIKALAKIKSQGIPLIVAHSGVFRVLCRVLHVVYPAERIDNARPVYCVAPTPDHPLWRLQTL